ncbi:hypothetical protein FOA52_007856 [Chlamydomonas sp. UWO 241]|nr:hypothetical protein FOA52_007856 [Chlamydomonas sp. UWO 241]
MEALRSVLAAVEAPPEGVLALLRALGPQSESGLVHICSYGGVGSTELSNFLKRHGIATNLLRDEDNLRHVGRPPRHGPCGPRVVVYLYGDPLSSIASHYRRGHALHQAIKTSGNHQLRAATFPPTFEAYVCRGADLFGYASHFRAWLREPTSGYDVVMVRYERMWEPGVACQLVHLLAGHARPPAEVGAMAEELCARRQTRLSQVPPDVHSVMYTHLVAEVDDALELHQPSAPPLSQVPPDVHGLMYTDLVAEMDALPPLLVRGADGQSVIEAYGDPGPADSNFDGQL